MGYAILRVERLKPPADVNNADRHGRRADIGTHYDPARTPLNRHWLGAMEARREVESDRARRVCSLPMYQLMYQKSRFRAVLAWPSR